jgi:hypothetical protein
LIEYTVFIRMLFIDYLRFCDSYNNHSNIWVREWKPVMGLRWQHRFPLLTICRQRSHKPASLPSFAVAGPLYTFQLHCAGLGWDCRLAFLVFLDLATLADVNRSEASVVFFSKTP